MGTEDYWQSEKRKIQKNADNINPILKQTEEDAKANLSLRNAKVLYSDCLKGALFWDQWARSEDLSTSEMAMMICRDMGCELTYCQATLYDPYERPFENCDAQFKALNDCIAQEQRRYLMDPQGRTMKEQIYYMLEKKKKEKYFNIVNLDVKTEQKEKEKEYFVKVDQTKNNEMTLDRKL